MLSAYGFLLSVVAPASAFFRACHRLNIFPRLSSVSRFLVLGTVVCFPALGTSWKFLIGVLIGSPRDCVCCDWLAEKTFLTIYDIVPLNYIIDIVP